MDFGATWSAKAVPSKLLGGDAGWPPAARLRILVTALFLLAVVNELTPERLAAQSATKRPAWTTSKVIGTPEPPEPYRVQPAFPHLKFNKPTSVTEIPGHRSLLVTEMSGRILSFANSREANEVYLVADLAQQLRGENRGGQVSLFSAALHPKFEQNHLLFVCLVHPDNGRETRVVRYKLEPRGDDTGWRIVEGSERVLITWPAGGHNAGCLRFGPEGLLFISTGDGSGPNPPDGLTTGQDISDLLGSILRIDVDRQDGDRPYSIPFDNPFVDVPGACPEIWSYGLRNPWKFGIDSANGRVMVADNGWETWELIHVASRGANAGWPVMEGRAVLRSEVKVGPTPIIPPVKDHPHSEANSVIGGPVYRGSLHSDLQGTFIYGDYITGTIWGLQTDDDSYVHSTLVDTDLRIVDFTAVSSGAIFVLDYDFTGQIYELLPSNLPDQSDSFPRKLSETGLFASVESLQPQQGVIAYDVKVGRWMDGAGARRWVAIPGRQSISLAAHPHTDSEYPEGTVFVKHVELPAADGKQATRLETQLMHFEHGRWHPYSYLWNDAGTDAELVEPIGTQRGINVADELADGGIDLRTWHVSAVNECRLCHNAGSKFVLGFVPNQLDRPTDSASSGQVERLSQLGVITRQPSDSTGSVAQLVDPQDETATLNDRARSYLHVNCSMCHHPGGNAIVSFYLRREMPFEQLNTNKGTGIGTFGMDHAKIIVTGDPYRSVLTYRMSKLGYARMPYIGSRVVDAEGVALISRWIESLPIDDPDLISSPLVAGSAEHQALQQLKAGGSANQTARNRAMSRLLKTTSGTLALVSLVYEQGLSSDDRRFLVKEAAELTDSNIVGLVEQLVPESARKQRLGPQIDPQSILALDGDTNRGKLIFFSDGARCRACHDLSDAQQSTGPTLRAIAKKYSKASELLQHILQPSLKIEDPFASYIVLTDDGKLLTGLVVRQSDTEVILRTAERKTLRIARDSIDEIQRSPRSLMPERILSDLTAQEAADLIAYLRSVKPNP